MFLVEPPRSQYDFNFRLFGFPIRIHPYFWLITVMLAASGGEGMRPADLLIWVVVVFTSILIHELGHAIMQRHFGGHPWITLYGMGGLASCDDCDRRPWSQILISLAGPAAGFLFALAVAAALRLSGHDVGVQIGNAPRPPGALPVPLPLATIYWSPLSSMNANFLIAQLFWINILWGMVNLLPIYPLDGGRVARELFTLSNPRRGIVLSLQLSVVAAALMAAYGAFGMQSLFTALFFGYLAYSSYRTLESYRSTW